MDYDFIQNLINENSKKKGKLTAIKTKNVSHIRKILNISQEKLADICNLSPEMVSLIERQKSGLSLDAAMRIIEFSLEKGYSISLNWLFGLHDNKECKPIVSLKNVQDFFMVEPFVEMEFFNEDGVLPIYTVTINEAMLKYINSAYNAKLNFSSNEWKYDVYDLHMKNIEEVFNANIIGNAQNKFSFTLMPNIENADGNALGALLNLLGYERLDNNV